MKFRLGMIRDYPMLTNKWMVASVLFLLWIVFFDENNLVEHRKNRLRLKALKEQRQFYREKIEADTRKMEELRSGAGNLEKDAREQFYMTKPDEELFRVVEE